MAGIRYLITRYLMAALGVLMISCVSLPRITFAETLEYQVKAAYLLNFARYAKWEERSLNMDPLILCTFKRNPFESVGYFVERRHVGGRPVIFRIAKNISELRGCHVAYLPQGEELSVPLILKDRNQQERLIVTETSMVGAINFIEHERRIKFDINLDIAEQGGITLDSQLLKLAVEISRSGNE